MLVSSRNRANISFCRIGNSFYVGFGAVLMGSTRPMQGEITPPGTGIIERPRLLQRLQGAFDHKLTLITAPPGFGKTTIVAQLTRGAPAQVTWQTIDERSRDLPNLYSQAIHT